MGALRGPTRGGGSRLAGLGSARPDRVVSASELVAPFGKTVEWLRARTGITELRRLDWRGQLPALATSAALYRFPRCRMSISPV